MTYVRRYSFKNHCYEKPEELPKNWHTPLITDNMDEIINCACCGKEVSFGRCFTSRKIFDMHGIFGFPVCRDCYEKELKEWRTAEIHEFTEKFE
ncbi:MAG: hypothetical protein MR707_08295 [Galactobacillus timonensis]|uniref:hypothetical protein n=1 Tax=Galactobacillus timonensis TaxID=2041840 RepID=UPI0023EFEF9F|nr:hypothetical protein [Galactobacillus timonensis]MCI6068205.1 hypothetical protein [Galactobacillus timonensis]